MAPSRRPKTKGGGAKGAGKALASRAPPSLEAEAEADADAADKPHVALAHLTLYAEAVGKAKHSVRELHALGTGIDSALGHDAPRGRRAAAQVAAERIERRGPSGSGRALSDPGPPWGPRPPPTGKRSRRKPPKDGKGGGFGRSPLRPSAAGEEFMGGGGGASPVRARAGAASTSSALEPAAAISVPRSASRAALAAAAAARAPPARPATLLASLVAAAVAARDSGAWPASRPPTLRQVMKSGVLAGQRVEFRPRAGGRPLAGTVTLDGLIDCGCAPCRAAGGGCVSCSDFEEHAGSRERRPGESIFLADAGASLKDLCAAAATAPYTGVGALHAPVCTACAEGGTLPGNGGGGGPPLVACRGCGTAAHARCLGPTPPASPWFCPVCVDASRSAGGPSGAAARWRPASAATAAPARVHVAAPASRPAGTAAAAARRDRNSNKHKRLFVATAAGALADGERLSYRTSAGAPLLGGTARVPPPGRHALPAGIECDCCGCVVSCSQFESHAGRGARRAPYDNIVNASGVSLRALAAAMPGGDVAGGGGGGGGRSRPPPSKAKGGGGAAAARAASDRAAATAAASAAAAAAAQAAFVPAGASGAPDPVPGGCVLCRGSDFDRETFGARTILICDQCEREFHVGCLHAHGRAALAELPEGDWFCSGECHAVSEALRRVVAARATPLAGGHHLTVTRGPDGSFGTGWALRAGAELLAESFDPILDGVTGADLTRAMVFSQCLGDWDCSNMHTALLKHRGVPVCAAVFRVFGARVAEVPLVATRGSARRQGHARVLMAALERLFDQLGVHTLALPAARETVGTWMHGFGFTHMAPLALRAARSELRILVFPGTQVLAKPVRAARGPPLLVPPPPAAAGGRRRGGGGSGTAPAGARAKAAAGGRAAAAATAAAAPPPSPPGSSSPLRSAGPPTPTTSGRVPRPVDSDDDKGDGKGGAARGKAAAPKRAPKRGAPAAAPKKGKKRAR
jgi:GNAT superfamily N-acetyltransferase